MACSTGKWVRAVDRLFVDGLSRRRFRRLRDHLVGCAECRAYYDKVAAAWRAMGPGATPSVVAESLADDLVADLAPRRAPLGRWLAAATAAFALAAAAWLISPRFHAGEWRERGAAPTRARAVRAFCLAPDAGGAQAVRGAISTAQGGATLHCPVGAGSLQFAYTLGDGAPEWLLLAARSPDGALLWYAPASVDAPAQPLQPGAFDEPLPSSTRLAVHHRAGPLTVEAWFLDHPAPASSLAAPAGVTAHQTLSLALDP